MKRGAREIGTVFYFTGYRKNDRRKREEVSHSVSELAAEAKERQQRESVSETCGGSSGGKSAMRTRLSGV